MNNIKTLWCVPATRSISTNFRMQSEKRPKASKRAQRHEYKTTTKKLVGFVVCVLLVCAIIVQRKKMHLKWKEECNFITHHHNYRDGWLDG